MLAEARLKLKQVTRALEDFESALELRQELDDRRGMAECHMKLGNLHANEQRFGHARGAYEECRQIREGLGDALGVAECEHALAQVSLWKVPA